MTKDYREGTQVREEFERTMIELFHAPKQEIEKRPKPKRKSKTSDKD